jgi:hypothetical protein
VSESSHLLLESSPKKRVLFFPTGSFNIRANNESRKDKDNQTYFPICTGTDAYRARRLDKVEDAGLNPPSQLSELKTTRLGLSFTYKSSASFKIACRSVTHKRARTQLSNDR